SVHYSPYNGKHTRTVVPCPDVKCSFTVKFPRKNGHEEKTNSGPLQLAAWSQTNCLKIPLH
ncbi:MAG: hypothetical protein KC421_12145, partial [Anaerolineales bacterium]|nr:hypothetical protein [Anaerolineales bacterium]